MYGQRNRHGENNPYDDGTAGLSPRHKHKTHRQLQGKNGTDSSSELLEGINPDHTFSVDFQDPELGSAHNVFRKSGYVSEENAVCYKVVNSHWPGYW